MKNAIKHLRQVIQLFVFICAFVPIPIRALVLEDLDALNSDQNYFQKNSLSTLSPEISLPHSHNFYQNLFIRGTEPRLPQNFKDFKKLGIKHIIIFKKDNRGEVSREIEILNKIGFSRSDVTHIPMEWSLFENLEETCGHVKMMLMQLDLNESKNIKTYLHCTVGEDRTSLADGLWQIWKMDTDSISFNQALVTVFNKRMCHYGYADGSQTASKPEFVINQIKKDLTPLYITMAKKIWSIKEQKINLSDLNCSNIKLSKESLECL